ncbi:hypothetical protein [Raoultella ornithinolytica]|uniref:Uncharacterized protein n=1 Tax=Raoultella ornithinolytica TaxID=54291 RepID=A0A9Q9J7R7_RAOOR|nr:hypothetical protein [Raoultella ornithinolytica]HDT5885594.1 hypothetical protein [Klebsiella pneumoniae subsp. pneumoniae]HDX8798794.1 hypothetical protein [Klebsiella michiganensis]UXE36464.1 hypothetical protein N2J37_18105 [Raoultella ornithinolytica]HDT5929630.1 hypothetical protein [Klebsiella pneumoniae subsp. pneumoniae]HDT6023211.1 hypothetical protein [Klebsiella pneumoniae subsp. pneumoniae]
MKEKKNTAFGVRLNDRHVELLDSLISEGKAKNRNGAVQYVLNMYQIKEEKK